MKIKNYGMLESGNKVFGASGFMCLVAVIVIVFVIVCTNISDQWIPVTQSTMGVTPILHANCISAFVFLIWNSVLQYKPMSLSQPIA